MSGTFLHSYWKSAKPFNISLWPFEGDQMRPAHIYLCPRSESSRLHLQLSSWLEQGYCRTKLCGSVIVHSTSPYIEPRSSQGLSPSPVQMTTSFLAMLTEVISTQLCGQSVGQSKSVGFFVSLSGFTICMLATVHTVCVAWAKLNFKLSESQWIFILYTACHIGKW